MNKERLSVKGEIIPALEQLLSSDFWGMTSEAQRQAYDEFYKLVFPMLLYMLNDRMLAEDIVQETFMRVVRKPPRTPIDHAAAWIKTVCRRAAWSHIRRWGGREMTLPSEIVQEKDAKRRQPDVIVEDKWLKEAVASYIRELKPEYRIVMYMRCVDRMSYRDIADQLRLSEGAVRQRLARARAIVRERLLKEWFV